MEFEDILVDIGDYGKYQKNMILIFLIPAGIMLPWFSMDIFFMLSIPDHWCNVPELSSSNFTLEQQKTLIAPQGEHCKRYDLNFTEILDLANYSVPNGSATLPCDRGWEYDQTYWDATAATKWNMVCDHDHYTSLILTMYSVGSIIGTPIYGYLSDKIGRRITFFIILIVKAVTSVSSVLMENFIAFVVIKTINGSIMPSIFQLPFIIILEIVAPEMRTRMNGIDNISWTVGLCILPLLAYFCRSWVTLGLLTSLVTLVFFFYYKFLPESPRWLVSQERYDEAAKILCQIAEKNRKSVEKNELIQKLKQLGEKMKNEMSENKEETSSLDLLRYPQLRKIFFIITICWIANNMSYYGLQLNISNLSGNEFMNFFLLGIAEVPGYLSSWYFMERFGRRWCSVTGFLLTGLSCMVSAIDFPYNDIIGSMFGKYFAALTFMATYQQSSELYPTVVRALGMGMSSTVSTLVTLITPFIVYLGVYGRAIPFVIIGMSGIIAGLLASLLPETLNENLPQSINDAEEFGKHQKFFSWNRRRLSVARERASLKGHKFKPDANKDDKNETKVYRSSQVLQKEEFIPGSVNTCISVDSVNVLNEGTNNTRKRNSTDVNAKECHAIDTVPNNPYRNESEDKQSKDSFLQSNEGPKQNIDVDKIEKSEGIQSSESLENDIENVENRASLHSGKDSNEFSYVNLVFDSNDGNLIKSDDVVVKDSKKGNVHSEHENSLKLDV